MFPLRDIHNISVSGGKAQHESLTFKPYESLEQRCEYFVPCISKTPQLSTVALPKLSQAFRRTFCCSALTRRQRSEKKENHLPAGSSAGGTRRGQTRAGERLMEFRGWGRKVADGNSGAGGAAGGSSRDGEEKWLMEIQGLEKRSG